MIDRVEQRPFVLWLAEAVAQAADDPESIDGSAPTRDELAEAQRVLGEAAQRERQEPLTAQPGDDRRGDEQRFIELSAYFPRDPALAIFQSVLERYLEEHAADRLVPIEDGDERRGDGDEGSATADVRLDISDADIPDELDTDRRFATAFEVTDPRWASSLFAMGWGKLKGKHAFKNEPAPPRTIASDARLVVFGDWASGLKRARSVASAARKYLETDSAGTRECHVVHLGDTYYAGWKFEYRKRLLPHWPVRPGEPHGSYSLNGNHDMMTGGHGYFDVLLADQRFAPYHQGSSWFSLDNGSWQLLGLDTAWEDHDLHGSQAQWVGSRIDENQGRKTMLLSHHQLFSAYGSGGPKLEGKLRAALASGRIDAWLWGHEHRCVVYEPQHDVRFARCIGHGGVPVYADHSKRSGVRWHADTSFKMGLEEWALMGFAVLDFDGPTIHARYFDEYGGERYEEKLS